MRKIALLSKKTPLVRHSAGFKANSRRDPGLDWDSTLGEDSELSSPNVLFLSLRRMFTCCHSSTC